MPKGHERILYTVDKVNTNAVGNAYFPAEVITRYTFRTRKAAEDFRAAKNKRTKKFAYTTPQRAVWGPDN